jgi:hypothetical protein
VPTVEHPKISFLVRVISAIEPIHHPSKNDVVLNLFFTKELFNRVEELLNFFIEIDPEEAIIKEEVGISPNRHPSHT